jgi:NADPH:quinone reductase-like Zn-dependent oxidoreductase
MTILKVMTADSRKTKTATMRAVRMHSYGGPEVLRYEEITRPRAGAGEILIKVHAAGVNPVDWKIREGYLKTMANHTLPLIPGWDFSGIVDSVGPGAERFEEGDEVFGRGDLLRNGAYAEYLVMREVDVEYRPKSVDHIHAAVIPLASLTAWQSLFEAANLQSGQSVLIHAAAGGVGHLAVQIAKWAGAHVIGTASRNNRDFLLELGVDEVIDYQTTPFEDVVHNVDVVLDTMGGDIQKRSWKVLAKGGILVSIVSQPSQQEADLYGVRQSFVFVQNNATQLSEIAYLVDSGMLVPVVENVLPLSEADRAQELNKAGHTCGKIVLQIV